MSTWYVYVGDYPFHRNKIYFPVGIKIIKRIWNRFLSPPSIFLYFMSIKVSLEVSFLEVTLLCNALTMSTIDTHSIVESTAVCCLDIGKHSLYQISEVKGKVMSPSHLTWWLNSIWYLLAVYNRKSGTHWTMVVARDKVNRKLFYLDWKKRSLYNCYSMSAVDLKIIYGTGGSIGGGSDGGRSGIWCSSSCSMVLLASKFECNATLKKLDLFSSGVVGRNG